MTAIEARSLTKRFGDFVAVDNISFAVPEGQVFGLLGANGAGKSTAIRMLCGLLEPSSGRALVAGIDAAKDPEAVKRSIGYMSQRFSLYEDLTVSQNISFFAGLYGLSSANAKAETERVLSLTGLSGRENELVLFLSAGYRQRLALACAIMHSPRVLFLDEPTAGVDPLARRRFWDIIYAIAESGSTVLVTTHYLDEAEYCSVVTLMHAGRIVASGSPAELKAEHFPGTMLEIECRESESMLELLRRIDGVEEAVLFGSKIHTALAPGLDEAALAASLGRAARTCTSIECIPPSLEDVFIRVISSNLGEEGTP